MVDRVAVTDRSRRHRCDVLVVGAGPAGAVTATALARAGARVVLVDRAGFPRDKACGDLVGPRGVQVLDDLGVEVPGSVPVTGMRVVGPTGREVLHPRHLGRTYADHGVVVPRETLDATLVDAARTAGAEFRRAAARAPLPGVAGFELSDRSRVRADVVVGADGALSRVGRAAGLVRPEAALWGFALRFYADAEVDLPTVVAWEPVAGRAFPGYGWVFPGPDGRANVGLGAGVLRERDRGATVADHVERFLSHLLRTGLLRTPPDPATRRGAWLRMGMVGADPGRGRVLLVGDAAGLVNPLQGEGIAEAMGSGLLAADAVLAGGDPAAAYRRAVAARYAGFQGAAAALHAAVLPRPRALATATRLLTAPGIGRALASGWAVYWNDLLDGARPSPARTVARVGGAAIDLATRRSAVRAAVADTGRQVTAVTDPTR